jgi:uncharacterized C2H2 Zn-finger protein
MFPTYCSLYVCCRGIRESWENELISHQNKSAGKKSGTLFTKKIENNLRWKNTGVLRQVTANGGKHFLRCCQNDTLHRQKQYTNT